MSKKARGGAQNQDAPQLLEAWGARVDPELLVLALTHRSFANEAGGIPNNERLEFLGDSVLSIVVTDELFHRFPDRPESDLARLRTGIVSQRPLAEAAEALGLGPYILLGVGENKTGGRQKPSILSDTFEALIGATYLSSGLEETRRALLKHLRGIIDDAEEPDSVADWKTPLRAYLQDNHLGELAFEVTPAGPDHDKRYAAGAYVSGALVATAIDRSRKLAENDAARVALERLKEGAGA